MVVGDALFREDETLPYKQALVDLTEELGIAEKVIFTGFREDIPEIMSILDILVLASWMEPLGMVQLEAMALEKPIIASNAGGPKEVVVDKQTGILVPPKDPQALANAVIELVKNNKLSYMGKTGRQRVERSFSLDSHVQKVERLYEEILSKKSACSL